MEIRLANEDDWRDIWKILRIVFLKGDSFPQDPTTTEEEGKRYWFEGALYTYVVILDDEIVGSYYLKNNQTGLGSHVANAGYIVKPEFRGQGIGKIMGLHSLKEAQGYGFKAIQFNLVVSTNTASIRLWKSLNFITVGTLPKAFNHKELGYVDAYVMYRELQ